MTTSTPHADSRGRPTLHRRFPRHSRRAGFTLAELLIAAAISTIVLAGALSTFYLLTRTGYRTAAYAEMANDLRVALERFSRDVRLARDVDWQSAHRVVLILPAADSPTPVHIAYGFEPENRMARVGRFYRETISASDEASSRTPLRETLATGVTDDFAFARYRLGAGDGPDRPAANNLETRLLEVRLQTVRINPAGIAVSQTAQSTRAVLRNKASAQ